MATFTGLLATNRLDNAIQNLIPVSYNGGRLRHVVDRFLSATMAANDDVTMARLPSHAVLNYLLSSFVNSAFGAGITLSIGAFNPPGFTGITNSATTLKAATSVAAASTGNVPLLNAITQHANRLFEAHGLSTDPRQMMDIRGTFAGGTPAAAQTLAWSITYAID